MLDLQQLKKASDSESFSLSKKNDAVTLLNEKYRTPNTSLLLFFFDPAAYSSSEHRLKECTIKHETVEGKDVYTFDDFFLDSENQVMRDYSRNATFSRTSYASQASREKGEEPARSMNNKEKWEFFAKPPHPVKEIYKLLGAMAKHLNAEISTLPWDICDQNICASAVATNRLERVSQASMDMGKHEDFNTEEGIPFGIPVLYSADKKYFPGRFINGAEGNPWLVSFMLYATEENFNPSEYGIGTVFCNKDEEVITEAEARHMRFVIFEGDIVHGIEKSNIPPDVKTWRVSYVLKLILNPKEAGKSIKKEFYELLKSYKKSL